MKYFHYLTTIGGNVLRIQARRRPSLATVPKCGTWVVRERTDGKWQMPCFPEITWGTVKQLEYLGSVAVNEPPTETPSGKQDETLSPTNKL